MRKPIVGLLVVLALVVAACSESTGSDHFEALAASPVGDGQEVVPAAPDPVAGLETFRSVGCAACHGSDGEGGIGPAIAGHTEDQVFRQVRTPKGDVMPAFSPDLLSDEEILDVVAWITSLGENMVMAHAPQGADEGDEPQVTDHQFALSNTEVAHMRLLLGAIDVGNLSDAARHLEHMTLHGAEPEVEEFALELQVDLAAGNLHDVEQKVVDALGSSADEDFDAVIAHIGMTISASQRSDDADVALHLAKAIEEDELDDHGVDLGSFLEDWLNDVDRHGVIDSLYGVLGQVHLGH